MTYRAGTPVAPAIGSRFALGGMVVALALLAACTPPEAARERGGGPGADPGNHGAIVWMHGGSEMYHSTPCVTTLPECTGPGQVSGFRAERID